MFQEPEVLIIKHLSKECSREEEEMLFSWIAQSEDNKRIYDETCQAWELSGVLKNKEIFEPEQAWKTVESRLGFKKVVITGHTAFRQVFRLAAAAVLLAVVAGFAYWLVSGRNNPEPALLTASSMGFVKTIDLPDGTRVWLNRESTLSYPEKFGSDSRMVTLTGEAFFDVTPDTQKPFLITTGIAQVRVVGTSFNVKSYPSMEATQVTVTSGKVKLSPAGRSDAAVVLLPGETGRNIKGSSAVTREKNSDVNYLAWKDHRLTFRETPLPLVASSIGAAYGIKVILKDSSMGNLLLTARYDETLSPQGILEIIALNFGLELQNKEPGEFLLGKKTGQ
ncbi:MAG: FecR domain-containing protein [Bacteroidales bacterium]